MHDNTKRVGVRKLRDSNAFSDISVDISVNLTKCHGAICFVASTRGNSFIREIIRKFF